MKYQLRRMVLINAGTNMHVPSGRITAIWPPCERKVLSIRWVPERPWEPPQIVCLKPGKWIGALGIDGVW